MLDLKKLSEKELAKRLLDFIKRAEQLENTITDFMNNKRDDSDVIRKNYKELKDVINEEYKYLSKVSSDCMDNISVVHNCYRSGVMEASAKGFTSRSNGMIDQSMFNSVEEALYYLCYYMQKSELEKYTNDR